MLSRDGGTVAYTAAREGGGSVTVIRRLGASARDRAARRLGRRSPAVGRRPPRCVRGAGGVRSTQVFVSDVARWRGAARARRGPAGVPRGAPPGAVGRRHDGRLHVRRLEPLRGEVQQRARRVRPRLERGARLASGDGANRSSPTKGSTRVATPSTQGRPAGRWGERSWSESGDAAEGSRGLLRADVDPSRSAPRHAEAEVTATTGRPRVHGEVLGPAGEAPSRAGTARSRALDLAGAADRRVGLQDSHPRAAPRGRARGGRRRALLAEPERALAVGAGGRAARAARGPPRPAAPSRCRDERGARAADGQRAPIAIGSQGTGGTTASPLQVPPPSLLPPR